MSACATCGRSLEHKRPGARYCSAACRAQAARERQAAVLDWEGLSRHRRRRPTSRQRNGIGPVQNGAEDSHRA